MGFTIVIPAYNEEAGIGQQIDAVFEALEGYGAPFAVIVVDDGSTDGTRVAAGRRPVQIVAQPQNRGYGAALKAGIARASTELVVIIDADGTYPAESIPALLREARDADMVVGARMNLENVPFSRRPAKALLTRLASYLAESDIPDLNSGLRVVRKSIVNRYEHILPAGFSFTTTITLAMLCNAYAVRFMPIAYRKRVGKSKIRPADAVQFLILVVRTVTLFNPLRVFLPLGLIPFVCGLAKLVYDLAGWNVSDGAIMGMLSGLIIWSVGILADVTSRAVLGLGK